MRDGIGAGLVGDLDQALGDQRTRNRSTQQVFAFVDGIGTEHREHVIARELLAQVLDVDLLDARRLGLGACRFNLFALADVRGKGDHLALVHVLQPLHDDRSVQTARVSENHFIDA